MDNTDDLKAALSLVAGQMHSVTSASVGAAQGGGSQHRGLPDDVRKAFIAIRTSLYQRGLYDPVLVRFDSASAPPASNSEIADQLTKIAGSLPAQA